MKVTGGNRDARDEHWDENTKTTGGGEAEAHANGEHIFHSHPKNTRCFRFVANKDTISAIERESVRRSHYEGVAATRHSSAPLAVRPNLLRTARSAAAISKMDRGIWRYCAHQRRNRPRGDPRFA